MPGQAFSDVRQNATGAPQRQPRAKENDPPEKLAGDIDIHHSTNDNHHTKPSVALLFQESAYAKLGDLDDMFDDDDDDGGAVV